MSLLTEFLMFLVEHGVSEIFFHHISFCAAFLTSFLYIFIGRTLLVLSLFTLVAPLPIFMRILLLNLFSNVIC